MIASQFNLDHRLAELRQVGIELRREQAARAGTGPIQALLATVRSFVGSVPSGRAAELAAH